MPQMTRTPGRHVTRRLTEPRGLGQAANQPGPTAAALASTHNEAVRQYGSDSGGYHTFNPATLTSEGVWDGSDGFPRNAVVTPLSYGRIDERTAQRLLEGDGYA